MMNTNTDEIYLIHNNLNAVRFWVITWLMCLEQHKNQIVKT